MDMQTYRDGRAEATAAAEAIRTALVALGFPECVWGAIRPLVTHSGSAYVHLGIVRAGVAATMAASMRTPVTRPVE